MPGVAAFRLRSFLGSHHLTARGRRRRMPSSWHFALIVPARRYRVSEEARTSWAQRIFKNQLWTQDEVYEVYEGAASFALRPLLKSLVVLAPKSCGVSARFGSLWQVGREIRSRSRRSPSPALVWIDNLIQINGPRIGQCYRSIEVPCGTEDRARGEHHGQCPADIAGCRGADVAPSSSQSSDQSEPAHCGGRIGRVA